MKTAVIIPAYNEGKTIENVLKVANDSQFVDEVIVVDDGSCDATAEIAKNNGARVIKMGKNFGKGKALDKGVKSTDKEFVLFLDADLIGLKKRHLDFLLGPVLEKRCDMSVGAIDRSQIGSFLNNIFQRTESPFSGIRAMKRDFWFKIPEKYKRDFYVESAITYFAKKNKLKVFPLVLHGVRHVTKEDKRGFWPGTKARWKMNFQIVFINIALRLKKQHGFSDSGN